MWLLDTGAYGALHCVYMLVRHSKACFLAFDAVTRVLKKHRIVGLFERLSSLHGKLLITVHVKNGLKNAKRKKKKKEEEDIFELIISLFHCVDSVKSLLLVILSFSTLAVNQQGNIATRRLKIQIEQIGLQS